MSSEAERAAAKRRYYDACDSIRRYKNLISNEEASKRKAENDISSLKKEKKGLEKRLEGVKKIIEMMQGSGGFFSTNVPDSIQKSNNASSKAGHDYRGCVRCSGVGSADFGGKFDSKSVTGNSNSNSALIALEAEKSRIERLIADIDSKIKSLENNIDTYKANIKYYKGQKSDWEGVKRRNSWW